MKVKLLSLGLCAAMIFAAMQANADGFVLKKNYLNASKSKAAGSMPEKPFNIKLNVLALGLRNVSLFGEYAFHKNMSAQLGFRFMLPYNAPTGGVSEITKASLTGWGLTPEFRFYPGKHEDAPAPHGFYIGLYGRYSKLNLAVGTLIDDPTNQGYKKATDFSIGVSHMGAGFIMGKQWAKNAFSVDWWIIAGGVGTTTISATLTDPLFKDPGAAKEIEDAFSSSDNTLFSPTVDVNTSTGTVKINQTGMGYNLRSLLLGGLCFGYHF